MALNKMTGYLLKTLFFTCLLFPAYPAAAEQGSLFVLESASTGKSSIDHELTRLSTGILQARLETLGEPYAAIEQRGDRRILLTLSRSSSEIADLVQQTLRQSRLEFRVVDDKARPNRIPADAELLYESSLESNGQLKKTPYIVKKKALLTGDIIAYASVSLEPQTQQPTVSISLNEQGTKSFATITARMIGRRLAVVIDRDVISAPVIRESIAGGKLSISGSFSIREAQDIASALNSNFLPANLKVTSKKDVAITIKQPVVDKTQIAQLEAQLARVQAEYDTSAKNSERMEQLRKSNLITSGNLEEARTARETAAVKLSETENALQRLYNSARPVVVQDSGQAAHTPPVTQQTASRTGTAASDVDTAIPAGRPAGKYDVAVVIGNANYSSTGTPNVDYALQDAQAMRQYLIKSFGYDPANVIYLENATLTKLNELFGTSDDHQGKLYKWVKPGQSHIFIYYVGHGAPDQQSGEGYFVPVDANPQYIRTSGYKLSTFYENLSRIPAVKKTVVIDACFSGSSANGQLLKGVSGLTARLKSEAKATVATNLLLTSAGMNQVAGWYPEKGHSLFTYFFLKGIQGGADSNRDGRITMGEMKAWLNDQVPYMARRLTGNEQQPVMAGQDSDELVVLKR